ncbi:MAG: hypothetical protein AAB710_02995, partial [Patescibacteria group bacterium]
MKKKTSSFVTPEETFIDTQNLPGFDQARFEGALEYPIRPRVFLWVGLIFFMVGLLVIGRTALLTLANGESYAARSEHNRLRHSTIIPERGIITDRAGVPLAFNVAGFRVSVDMRKTDRATLAQLLTDVAPLVGKDVHELLEFVETHGRDKEIVVGMLRDWSSATHLITRWKDTNALSIEHTPLRAYDVHPAFSHLLGYINSITKEDVEQDQNALLWGERGRSGVELAYDEQLRGMLCVKIIETDSEGMVMSEGIYQKEERGKNI